MSDFYSMLSTITRRRQSVSTSPFASRESVTKWLQALPQESDYDAHHALVEGLERFNAETVQASAERLRVLMALEEAGLPLQARIVEQYVRNQSSFKLARQALWRESHMFWSQLAYAYLDFLKQAFRGPAKSELQVRVSHIAVCALRYAGLTMRWEYHQGQTPSNTAWRRLHKIYRLTERGGYDRKPIALGDDSTHCAREYTLIHLMGLVQPLGYRAQEIEEIARLFETYPELPLPEARLSPDTHTHAIDLSMDESAFVLDGQWVPGTRLRYFALRPLIDYLQTVDSSSDQPGMANLGRQLASMIDRGGVRRDRPRTHRFGRVWVAAGIDNILSALLQADSTNERPALDPWMLRDESVEGMGFTLPDHRHLPNGRLVAVSWDPAESVWQLLAIRWNREENGQCLIGAQRLTRHPKLVRLFEEGEEAGRAQSEVNVLFMPMSDSSQGVSNLLMPGSMYHFGKNVSLRDGDLIYRLRLGEALEVHEGWLRVGMDVLGREHLEQAA